MSRIHDVISRTNESVIRSRMISFRMPRKYYQGLSTILAQTLGVRDPYLLDHSLGVVNFATNLAQRLGLPQQRVDLIGRGSLFHDIGKLCISQEILSKPTLLTPNEYETVKTHVSLGEAILQECPDTRALISIVRQHHEFFDGRGYPDGISGNKIEIEARIVSVADAIDAMRSDRPYRRALSMQKITVELERCANTQFDPLVVEPAIQILKEMKTEKRTSLQAILNP